MGRDIPFAMRNRSTKYRLIAIYILLLLFCSFVYFQSLLTLSVGKGGDFIHAEKRNLDEQQEDQRVSYHLTPNELFHDLADLQR